MEASRQRFIIFSKCFHIFFACICVVFGVRVCLCVCLLSQLSEIPPMRVLPRKPSCARASIAARENFSRSTFLNEPGHYTPVITLVHLLSTTMSPPSHSMLWPLLLRSLVYLAHSGLRASSERPRLKLPPNRMLLRASSNKRKRSTTVVQVKYTAFLPWSLLG